MSFILRDAKEKKKNKKWISLSNLQSGDHLSPPLGGQIVVIRLVILSGPKHHFCYKSAGEKDASKLE